MFNSTTDFLLLQLFSKQATQDYCENDKTVRRILFILFPPTFSVGRSVKIHSALRKKLGQSNRLPYFLIAQAYSNLRPPGYYELKSNRLME